MAKEPENIVHVLLREIRAKLDDVYARVGSVETRVQHVEKLVEDLHMTATYSLGQSTETQFKQSKQAAQIDELFSKVEKLLEAEKSR
jgi:uncharacterized protein YoxC